MKLLFICTENLQRSPTAEKLFKDRFETKSAGIFSKSNPVTTELLDWADAVVVMEKWHRKMLVSIFPERCKGKHILCLDIPDRHYRDDPTLVKLLETKVMKMLQD